MVATMSFSERMRARMAKRTDEVAATVVPEAKVKPIARATEEERDEARGRRMWIEWQEAFEVILANQVAKYGMMG